MRKQILTTALLALLLSLTACNVQVNVTDSGSTGSTAEETEKSNVDKEIKLPDDFRVEKQASFEYDYKTEVLDDYGHERELTELDPDDYQKLYDSLKNMGFTVSGGSDEYSARYYFYKYDEIFVIDYEKELTYYEGTDEEYTNPSGITMHWYKASSKYISSSEERDRILSCVKEIEEDDDLFEPSFDCVIDETSDFLYEQMGFKYVRVPAPNPYYPYACQSYLVGSDGVVPIGTEGFSGPLTTPFICDIDSDGEFEVIMLTSVGSGECYPVLIAYGAKDGKPYEKYNHQFVDIGTDKFNALLQPDECFVNDDGKSFEVKYKTELTGEIKSFRVCYKDGDFSVVEE